MIPADKKNARLKHIAVYFEGEQEEEKINIDERREASEALKKEMRDVEKPVLLKAQKKPTQRKQFSNSINWILGSMNQTLTRQSVRIFSAFNKFLVSLLA